MSGRLPALREPAFRNLFAGQALSRLGDRIAPIALAFGVIQSGGSAGELGLVVAAGSIPFALFALAAGVWADRIPRRRVMIASDAVRALVQLATGLLLITGSAEIWMLAALAAVYGTGDAFFWPAMNGLLPETIATDRLQEANALLGTAQSSSNILGPVIAGVLIALVDPGGAILLDAATFVFSIAFLLRLTPRAVDVGEEPAPAEEEGFLEQLRGGWREVRSRAWVWTGLIALSAYHVIVLPSVFVLGPILAHRELDGASDWATITAGFGVGAVAGQVLIYRLPFKRPMRASMIGFVVASSQAAIIGSGLPVLGIAALEALTGVAVSVAFTLWETSLQQHIPSRALSRVSSYDFTASAGLMPIGLALAGPFSGAVGLHAALHLMSLVGVASALACLAVPSVRALTRPEKRG
ncbi:MAG TPA: MFS transporter [Solirubrobacteraceae bacterium]|jgi:MFS family permease|nr:MFS transporter [Solirubrobacteraceae bacterium]